MQRNKTRLRLHRRYLQWPLAVVAAAVALSTPAAVTPARGERNAVVVMYQPGGHNSASASSRPPWTDNHCGRCHPIDAMLSHPIDVTAPMDVPEMLPLADGKVTCITCHDDRVEAHVHARFSHTPMLREGLMESQLCVQCHNPSENTRVSQHGSSLGRAHLTWSGRRAGAEDVPDGMYDAETHACLTCHDGTISPDVGLSSSLQLGVSRSVEHPVGVSVDEPQALADGIIPDMHPSGLIDSRVRLFDGRVGCASCHSLFSREEGLLVMSNDHSRLCLSCHNQ